MKSKFKLILWPVIYLVLIINVCISFVLVFRSYYFKSIFVSGSSMEPTLHGNVADVVDYGIIDDHDSAINSIKRFQIITTYYPFADSKDYERPYIHNPDPTKGEKNVISETDSSYKIKRVYGLPGETIRFELDNEYAEAAKSYKDSYSAQAQDAAQKAVQFYVKTNDNEGFVKQTIKFKRKINIAKIDDYKDYEFTLADDEFWVMGDNYSASSECFTKKAPIYKDNIVGVLIAIEGTRKIVSSVNIDTTEDGTKVSYKCTQRKRHLPVYY